MSRRTSLLACLRMVLLAMLMLGTCLQPVLAAACDVEDVRIVFDHDADAASTADDAGDCCANPACGDCCLHATAQLPATQLLMTGLRPGNCSTPTCLDFASSDESVDQRPPITN
ncbi:hypothetical protein [Thermomonas carbonis]|uniref:CopL family metal-binding regulatory protein n=1 Tax=Thermomonas carbonis TaxID=1463158 RepID=A0A7G9SSH6_9GAMM|nr:hypothetical protein [Thermomonas carbonis]QNN70801.1 hypothetical protein H9L16_04190 [Thermomonas carbonis]GHC02508.1 hypothetical protein GCM10010080_15430 [Thermomonas carbonis]